MKTKTKIAVLDDHILFRDGIVELINDFEKFIVSLEADNGLDFTQQLNEENMPEIVLLDINMKLMDGYETGVWLKENHPEIKILVLSMYDNENAVIRMLRLGARGYILKDIRKKELELALLSVRDKGYYYTEMITGKLINALQSAEGTSPANSTIISTLHAREMEFLKLACSELTYKAIAEKMTVSIHTIDGYRDALFEKLSVKSRVGLVLFAIKNKIMFVE